MKGFFSIKQDHEDDWFTEEPCDCESGGDRWTKTAVYRPNPKDGK